MNHYGRLLVWVAAISVMGFAVPAGAIPPQQRLASELIRTALSRTMAEPLLIDALESAVVLANEAVELDPENHELWRIVLDVAIMAEHDQFRNRAVERLTLLDPNDESIRLMRLTAAIDRYQTVEERMAVYEQFLSEENLPRLGPAAASRLALDLALLFRRQGDVEMFARRLSQSIALDSTNRAAAAIAAGFHRMNVQDTFAQAELLTHLMLADPTDTATQVVLAQLLLEHGAYVAAERLYRLATNSMLAAGNSPSNDLLADQVIALWACGKLDEALETLRKRQADADASFRHQARRENPELSGLESNQLKAPADPTLATVAAVIHADQADDQAGPSLEAAIVAYQTKINEMKATSDEAEPAELARLNLEMAWVALWLGGDLEQVSGFIATAEELEPLSQNAKDRFEGLLTYRRGDAAKALELLRPLAAEDVTAQVGLALALLQQGQTKEAARQLLTVNKAQPGSLMGIWASGRLAALLGQRLPLSDEAAQLETLIASISAAFDRYPQDPSLAVGLRVVPSKLTFAPYEPIVFNIELTNNSIFPLALDREGALRPQVIIAPTVRSPNASESGPLKPFVVNVGRKLRLMPREKITVPVNLRDYHPGEVLNLLAAKGSIVKIVALVNFAVNPQGNLKPSLYGVEVEAPSIRVDGVRVDNQWIDQTTTALHQPELEDRLERLAILSHTIAPRLTKDTPQEDRPRIEAARRAFEEAYSSLDGVSQAWLLSVMPAGERAAIEGLQPVLVMAKKSPDRLVQMSYLVYHSTERDPMVDAARRSGDPALQAIAELLHAETQRKKKR